MKTTRRQFLGLLGTGGIATAGLSQTAAAQQTPVVKMENNYFDPIGLYIDPGTTVRFEIAAGAHSTTTYDGRIPSGGSPFDSGVISEGSYEYTFETTGTYDYYCIPHKSLGMVGRIVVGQPAGPAEETPIPDGTVPDSEVIVQQGSVPYESNSDSGGYSRGGMMGSGMGPGMMSGRRSGWFVNLPLAGGALGVLGVVGGALYWALNRTGTARESDDSAMDVLRSRYAQGDIDEDEFQRRQQRLANDREE
ncbi:putative copper binding protein [Haloferax prahovense DSM 18310]|uniref:Copper binding protein n=1 Tax=Haloferax prahovense (strain DSM 18310 / JCM 13924 / TL6) TaxID=1227461 RepID=M0G9L8_HALPT|nr:plastocyanin/azurin family copper-binding protein [Haloferax prahovense]ELZ68905.1 putative copper binding protein [Haloferax prahovense DSM 18310]